VKAIDHDPIEAGEKSEDRRQDVGDLLFRLVPAELADEPAAEALGIRGRHVEENVVEKLQDREPGMRVDEAIEGPGIALV
jgi:hypothetical protein